MKGVSIFSSDWFVEGGRFSNVEPFLGRLSFYLITFIF